MTNEAARINESQMVKFSVALPPKALRRNSETRNHNYRAALVREYQEAVWCAGQPATDAITAYKNGTESPSDRYQKIVARHRAPWPRARVHYVWHSTHRCDEDNIIASMKPALDVLKATGPRPLRIIQDDAGAVVSASWRKVQRRADEHVEIEIVRLPDDY